MNTDLVNQSFNLKEKKKKQETKTILVKEMKVEDGKGKQEGDYECVQSCVETKV